MDDLKVPPYPRTAHKGRYARIKLGDRHVQLGIWGSAESRAKYRRVVGEYLATGRVPGQDRGSTVADVVRDWRAYLARTYRKRGEPTAHVQLGRSATHALLDLYGTMPAAEFGPGQLKALRAHWVRRGLCRVVANNYAWMVVLCWRWAAEEGRVPGSCWADLKAVRPLARGRSEAVDYPPIGPIDEATYQRTLAVASEPLGTMMRLQKLTGMRPAEVCGMRAGDIVREEGVAIWAYRVRDDANKETHAHRARLVALGPGARAILGPLLQGLGPEDHVFRPTGRGMRKARGHLTAKRYNARLARACRRAGVPVWGPNRLRHNAATAIEAATGDLDSARAILGHRDQGTTGCYVTPDARALRDFRAAAAVAEAMG